MTRSRNFLPLAGFLVCVAAFLSYPLFFARFPVTRDIPWASWLLFALGLVLAGMGIRRAYRSPERYRGRIAGPVLGVLGLAVAVLFFLTVEVYSRQLPPSTTAPHVGQKAPDFTLPDAQGKRVRLDELLRTPAPAGSWVLLIFYRGYW
jgi:hypothetical protein